MRLRTMYVRRCVRTWGHGTSGSATRSGFGGSSQTLGDGLRADAQPRRPSSGSTVLRSGASTATSARSRTIGFALNATPSRARPSSRGRSRRRRSRSCDRGGCRSPTPTPRARRPCRAHRRSSPSTRPVSRPSATSRRLARQKSRPRRSGERVEDLVEAAGDHADPAAGRVHAVDELVHAGRRRRSGRAPARRRDSASPPASPPARAGSRRSRARRASPAR